MKSNKQIMKRSVSRLSAVIIAAFMLSISALASEPEAAGLCAHHTEHTAACGYTAATEENAGTPCGFVCAVCPVQTLIDALPSADDVAQMDSAAQLAAYDQFQKAVDAANGLSEAEQAQLEQSKLTELTNYYNSLEQSDHPGDDPSHIHSYQQEITTEPGCITDGVMTYTCSCGDSYTETIPAVGHTVVIDPAQDATLTEDGLTEGSHCSVCDEVFVAQEVIPAPGNYSGWAQIDDAWYYYIDGVMQTGWFPLDDSLYYLGTDGKRVAGSQYIDGRWYYFDISGMMQTGWQPLDGKTYYLGTDGKMVTGSQEIGGYWYYFDDWGVMQTGWKTLDGKTYYLGTDGKMVTGSQQIGGDWYYFNSYGIMQTGWKTLDGKTY